MAKTRNQAGGQRPSPPPLPHVGAFVLETLTLGMYGEPRHTLREYVQNSFDAIRSAQRLKVLTERGAVVVTLADDQITIRDNGLGVPSQQAYRTLTSVGASKKDRQRDAGFRGIGRLAGMAYCDTLSFETSFPGETVLTTVTFNCRKLLEAMAPDSGGDVELSQLLASAIEFGQTMDAASAANHYFEVRMSGLARAPATLTDDDEVRKYLSETVPVPFDPAWARAAEIEQGYRGFFGEPMETIDVLVRRGRSQTKIHRPYRDVYEHAKGEAELASVDFEHDPEGRYWGWIGRLRESVSVTDPQTRGLRVRVRNIQVDGTQLFEQLFSEVKPSYARFTFYYVGEIHLNPECIVPNARRDGFEETPDWLGIKKDLVENVCDDLATEAYKASEDAQTEINKVVKQVNQLIDRGRKLSASPKASYEQVVELLGKARRLRRNVSSALRVASSVDETNADEAGSSAATNVVALQDATRDVDAIEAQARMLLGRFMDDDEKIASLRARIREEVMTEMLDIVNAYVDPRTYQAIRRRLMAMK